MISVENISKSFGANVLFEGVSFKLNRRERIGLTGRNGHGKTTLLKMIVGEEQPDSGTIIIPKTYRIGYVKQEIAFTKPTVIEEGMTSLPVSERDHRWKVEKILAGLGFTLKDMQRSPDEFSGGFQVRLNLAKVLVSEPDLLLLDEPTNYLDIASIRWVEQFLIRWPHEVMLITHDRSFMDKVVTHIVGIHRKKVRKIEGDTGKFYAQLAQEEEVYEKTRINDERRRKEIELFISRFRAKARLANMVQSRIKTLSKMDKRDKLESLKTLDFSFKNQPFSGKFVMSAENICFGYDPSAPLIRNFNLTVRAGDRICIVGKNGKGKTTLLKILSGSLAPNTGKISYHPQVVKGFFEQTNVQTLVDSRTVEEEILYSDTGMDKQQARNICGAMMFEGDEALKRISVLSGGEKSRVMLGKLLAAPLNFLLLDEPTNHLDMESCDALLSALDNFKGAVMLVTHNELFLHAIAQRLIVFQNEEVSVFEGSYARFLEKGGWGDEDTSLQTAPVSDPDEELKRNRKELRRIRSEIITERGKALKPLEQKIAHTENEIERYEQELEALHTAMQEASMSGNGIRIKEIARSVRMCETEIDRLFKELEIFTADFDAQHAVFEKRLEEIERI